MHTFIFKDLIRVDSHSGPSHDWSEDPKAIHGLRNAGTVTSPSDEKHSQHKPGRITAQEEAPPTTVDLLLLTAPTTRSRSRPPKAKENDGEPE